MLPNGNLLTLAGDASLPTPVMAPGQVPTFEQHVRMQGGGATHLLESTWDGDVVWRYENPAIHHDFVRLPNGNTWLPEIVELPADVARQVRGGRRERGKQPRHDLGRLHRDRPQRARSCAAGTSGSCSTRGATRSARWSAATPGPTPTAST